MRERRHTLNGGFTDAPAAATPRRRMGYNDAKTVKSESTNATNAWSASRTGSSSGNNKNNSNHSRPVAALGEWESFYWSVVEAFNECVKHKLSTKQAMDYLPIAAEDVPRLAEEIWAGRYAPSASTCFMVKFPKLREVFAADFRDRIVHHWIHQRLSPIYEEECNRLGNPTHACRLGFGNRTAVEQVERAMLNISHNYRRPCGVYRGDIVAFFMSFDKARMWRVVSGVINTNAWRWAWWEHYLLLTLSYITIMHSPHKNCIINSDPELWREIDPGKSMFYVTDGKAMPIGNLTTQLFAGFYMLDFIRFVQGRFRDYFGPYWYTHASITVSVDDFIIVCDDWQRLKRIVKEAEKYLDDVLLLRCHSEKTYLQPVGRGVKFLGKWLKPHRRYIIDRTVKRFRKAVKDSIAAAEGGLSPIGAERIRASLNSYLGIMKGTRSQKIIERAFSEVTPAWQRYFEFSNNKIVIRR